MIITKYDKSLQGKRNPPVNSLVSGGGGGPGKWRSRWSYRVIEQYQFTHDNYTRQFKSNVNYQQGCAQEFVQGEVVINQFSPGGDQCSLGPENPQKLQIFLIQGAQPPPLCTPLITTPYFQPMIQYLNKKEIYGPYHTRTPVYLPHSAEVTSDKFNNM